MIFFLYLPHFYTPCAHEGYIWHQLENIKQASMKMKTREEFWNLHWDVPEHQGAAPEAVLIHRVLCRTASTTYLQTELPKLEGYVLNALPIFQQISRGGSLITTCYI